MDNILLLASALFLLTLLAGFWLLKTGKPYRSGIFTLHKLLALGATILALYTFFGRGNDGNLQAWLFFGMGILLVLLLFASGASLSIGKPDHPLILLAHRIAVVLSVLIGILLYFSIYSGVF